MDVSKIKKKDIFVKIKEVIKEELFFDEDFKKSTLIRDLGLDSIQIMQLFVYIEETYDFEFEDENTIENMRDASVNDLVDFVYKALMSSVKHSK